MVADNTIHERLHAYERELKHGEAFAVIPDLARWLSAYCLEGGATWQHVREICRHHPLYRLLEQDPYTRRAREKPRGYAGDAVMIDYVYQRLPPVDISSLGERAFLATTGLPNGASVRHRRTLLARAIDEEAERINATTENPLRVLAIACGHLREVEISYAAMAGKTNILALDQDAESLRVVAKVAVPGVTPLHANIIDVLRNRHELGQFDLIYAAGLTDYLPDGVAKRLVTWASSKLNPGGLLILGNFATCNSGRAYMEAFMDWTLICREPAQMLDWFGALPSDSPIPQLHNDPFDNVIYARWRASDKLLQTLDLT